MDIRKPIGDSAYGPFVLRLVIGTYLFMVGLVPLNDIQGLVAGIQRYYNCQESFAMLVGSTFPYLCMITGFFLIVGLWTTLAAIFASGIFLFGIYGFGITPDPYTPFNRDIMTVAGCVCLMYTGAGFFSIDSFRKG